MIAGLSLNQAAWCWAVFSFWSTDWTFAPALQTASITDGLGL